MTPSPPPAFPPPPEWEVQNKIDKEKEDRDQERTIAALETIAVALESIARNYDRRV